MHREALLQKVSIFAGLSIPDLGQIAKIARTRRYARGEAVFSESSSGDSLFIVASGRVKIFSRSSTGRTKTFAFLEPKDIFGEMALLDQNTRSASAQAVQDSTLLVIPKQDFKKLLGRYPKLSFSLLQTVCARLRWADQEIKLMSFNNVLGRLARILLDLAQRYGAQTGDGVRIELELSNQELADLVGTAREMVSRVLHRLSRTGCLQLGKRSIVIRDPEKLKAWVY
jgi:CRP/FNR family transcriptional regulator